MNKVELMGRLTKDPEVRHSTGSDAMAISRYTLAVPRRSSTGGTDFISVVAFGKSAEFAEKYLKKGTKIVLVGRIMTGSYTNKEGNTVYTTEVVAEEQEFAESKSVGTAGEQQNAVSEPQVTVNDGFVSIPEGMDADMPFH